MKERHEPQNPELVSDWKWAKKDKIAVLGMAAIGGLTVATYGAWQHFSQAGDYRTFGPYQQIDTVIDNHTNIASWNMENRVTGLIPQVKEITSNNDLDVFLIQEGSIGAARKLGHAMPNWNIVSITTEAKNNITNGGQSLIIISKQKPRDYESVVFNGPSFADTMFRVFKGVTKDIVESAEAAEPITKNTRRGLQESRVSAAFTIKVQYRDRLEDVRIVTGHVSPAREFHDEQLDKNIAFVKENIKEGRPLIVCMDWNDDPDVIIPRLAEIGLITPQTRPTSDDNRTIDFCSYYPARKKLGIGVGAVLPIYGSDHRPITIRFTSG